MNDVWLGDCLELMQNIPAKSVDMILCDLPYGTTACKWDTIIPFEPLWAQYKRIIKDNGAIVLFGSQPFTSALVMSNPKWFKYELIWEKPNPSNPMLAKKQTLKNHENILLFYKNQCTFNPQMELRLEKDKRSQVEKELGIFKHTGQKRIIPNAMGEYKYPMSVRKFNREQTGFHPTQKPVALFEYLIKTYTNEGETVLDNCAGSGTTAIACLNTNRNYICIEKEPKYYEIINKRIEAHIKQQNTKLF